MQKEKVIIERKKRWTDSRYSVGIYIDDVFIVNTIKNNRQEIELPVGKHTLKVKQGNKSGEIEIDVKKGKTHTCIFTSNQLTILTYILFTGAWIVPQMFEPRNNLFYLFLVPALLLYIYTLTSGRKKYFVFEEIREEHSWLDQQL